MHVLYIDRLKGRSVAQSKRDIAGGTGTHLRLYIGTQQLTNRDEPRASALRHEDNAVLEKDGIVR